MFRPANPIDTAILTYRRQFTRFENFVAEAGYVEGKY